jgi:hypothetical protein
MMHVSWTTLREQIFAKLRRPYRSEADMNEVGHGKASSSFGVDTRCPPDPGSLIDVW